MSATTFRYERQELPLSQKALTDLETLRRNNTTATSLSALCSQATKFLNEVVQEANDRASEEVEGYKRSCRIREKKGVADTGEKARLEAYQDRVDELSRKVDRHVRQMVDVKVWSNSVVGSLQHVSTKSREAQDRWAVRKDDEERRGEEEGTTVASSGTRPAGLEQAEVSSSLLHAALSTAELEHTSKTLTERYSRDATYKQFYELYWEAKHSNTDPKPILPHPSIWFAAEEGRRVGQLPRGMSGTQQSTRGDGQDGEDQDMDTSNMPGFFPHSDVPTAEDGDEDDEIQMRAESRSMFCPLSMRKFVDPVVSTKCPHTFEREAIRSFIDGQHTRLPLSPTQQAELDAKYGPAQNGRRGAARNGAEADMMSRQPKCAKCPVCLTLLTTNDLGDDLLMRRQIRKAEEEERRAAENEDEDDNSEDELMAPTQSRRKVFALRSSPVAEIKRPARSEDSGGEGINVIPNSQSQGLGETVPQFGVEDVDDVDETMNDDR